VFLGGGGIDMELSIGGGGRRVLLGIAKNAK
jgi:hypothetical protein